MIGLQTPLESNETTGMNPMQINSSRCLYKVDQTLKKDMKDMRHEALKNITIKICFLVSLIQYLNYSITREIQNLQTVCTPFS